MSKICPSCTTDNEDTAIFCDNCGSSFAVIKPVSAPGAGQAAQPLVLQSAPPGNVACPTCSHPALLGEMFCDNCGASLGSGGPVLLTPAASIQSVHPAPPMPAYRPAPQSGMPQVQPSMDGRLVIGGAQIPIPQKLEVTIGRSDQFIQPPWQPDIDLTRYGGGDPTSGVSRRHAKLVWLGGWYIEDMNSVNGVFVRGQKIFQRTILNNADQIALGHLILTYYAGQA